VLEQLGQHPQQEGGVQPRRVHQLVGGQDVDHAFALASVCMKSSMLSMGSPKNCVAALLFDLHQAALDGADAGGADVAVFGGDSWLALSPTCWQHGAQVFHVEQQQAVVIGDLEHQVAARRPGFRSGSACGPAAAGPGR